MAKIYRQGNLRADKVLYKDGVGCCIWYPFPGHEDDDEDMGICFDFSYDDIDNFIALLQTLKIVEPDIFVDKEDDTV